MASTVFNLGGVKILKNLLRFQSSDVQIITGQSADPTVTPVDAVAGSLYIRTNGEVYIKNTSGSNTDFRKVTDQAALDAHINDLTDAHDASAISSVPSGNLSATNVQDALNELQTDIDTRATQTALNDHLNDAVDAHDASAISNVPAGNLAATDVQGALNELQSDVDTRALDSVVIKKDGSVAFTGNQSMGGFKLTSLGAPTAATDAATKEYVDNALEGLRPKEAVRVATTANITLSGLQTIDGVSVVAGNRVLVKDQSLPENNGIYVAASGSWTRATDFDSLTPIDEINKAYVAVQEGSANAGKLYVQFGIVTALGVDPINFTFFNSVSGLIGGDGITVSGANISVDHDGQGLDFVAGQLALELDGATLSKSATGLKVSDGGISNLQINAAAAIDATKIAAGTVDNTEFGYLNGVTSAIQTQLDSKANQALSNLTTTSINESLIPNTNATRDLGTSSLRWRKLFAATIDNANGPAIDVGAQALTNNGTLIASWSSSAVTIRPNILLSFRSPDNASGVSLQGPANGTTNTTYTLPGDGTNGQYLQTNGAGVLSWTTPAPGYTDEQAQDAVGNILVDSSKIDFTYNDATPSITATIVAGSLVNADISPTAAIDATKIGAGTVDNTEFGYLNGVTSAIQTQLNNRATINLDNVENTSIPASLIAQTNNIFDLGSTNLRWKDIWADTSVRAPSHVVIGNGGGNGTVNGELRALSSSETPDSIALAVALINGSFGRTGIVTAANAVANSTATGDVLVGTGNKTAGTGNSGNINLVTGSSAGGTRGSVVINAPATVIRTGQEVRFNNTANTFYTSLKAGSNAANLNLTLPIADGSAGHVLQTDGSGVLSFAPAAPVGVTTLVTGTNVSLGSNVTNEVVTGLTFAHATFNGCEVRYRIKKGTLVRTGTFLLATDGTQVSFNDAFVETVDSTIVFEAVINGANINIRHTNTETGTIQMTFEQSLFPV